MMTDHDVFWLARYAHNTLAPLFKQAQVIEPSIQFAIEMEFSHPGAPYTKKKAVSVTAHWARPSMFVQTYGHTTKADIDNLADKLRKDIEKMQADVLADALMVL